MFAHVARSIVARVSIVVCLVSVAFAAGSAYAQTAEDLRRVDEQGPVAIAVTYLNPLRQGASDGVFFEVRMNTHSVDLDAYTKENHAFLRIDDGAEQKALGWLEPGGGGHHVYGVLKFAGPAPSGPATLQLVIRDIGDVPERVFEWTLPTQ